MVGTIEELLGLESEGARGSIPRFWLYVVGAFAVTTMVAAAIAYPRPTAAVVLPGLMGVAAFRRAGSHKR